MRLAFECGRLDRITGASSAVRRELITHGVSPPRAKFRETVERAVADIKGYNGEAAVAAPQEQRRDDVAAS